MQIIVAKFFLKNIIWIVNTYAKSVHEGKKSFKCSIWVTSFTQKVNLNGHIRISSWGKENTQIMCYPDENIIADRLLYPILNLGRISPLNLLFKFKISLSKIVILHRSRTKILFRETSMSNMHLRKEISIFNL